MMAVLLLVGCSRKQSVEDEKSLTDDTVDEDTKIGYPFEYQGVNILVNEDAVPVLEELGEAMDYVETPSCAFLGTDKFYYYSGIELATYPSDDKDYIYYIEFMDDTVATKEGISIGSSVDEMITAYGEDYEEEIGTNTSYTYTLGDSKLIFVTDDDTITGITYMSDVLE